MASRNETCVFCGGEIAFRVIRGVTTPIHHGSADCVGRRLYHRDQEGVPYNANCPICRKAVIFLRHNGGSIWLDSVGWPWPKHGCFDENVPRFLQKFTLPAEAYAFKSPSFLFAMSLGKLVSGDGVAVLLCADKKCFRKNPKYLSEFQYEVMCAANQLETLDRILDGIPVIVSLQEDRLVTYDGSSHPLRKHQPHYYSRFSIRQ